MASSILRFFAGAREAFHAAGEIRSAHTAGLCVNCKERQTAVIPATATAPATRALLCDGCGEAAANASANVLGAVTQKTLESSLAEMFTGRRK